MSIFNFMAQGIHEMVDEGQRVKDRNQAQAQFDAELAWQKENAQNQLDEQARQFDTQQARLNSEFETNTQLARDNLQQQKDIAENNLALQQSQLDYQKQLNETQMEREDTALQRQMADAEAAGLSPLSVVGGNGASSAPLSAGEAPQLDPTGISAAQGQYLDLARQYSNLYLQSSSRYADAVKDIQKNYTNAVSNGYNSYRQQQATLKAANIAARQQENASRRGARVALTQMITNASMQGISLAQKADEIKMQKALNDSQIGLQAEQMKNLESERLYRDAERKYNEDYGFRNQNFESALIGLAEYIKNNRNDPTIQQAKEKVQQTYDNVVDSLGLTKESRDKVVEVSVSKYHNGQSPKEYLLSMKNAIDIYSTLKSNKSINDKDIQKLWDTTPLLRKEFNNNYTNFKFACNSPKFIKSIILE